MRTMPVQPTVKPPVQSTVKAPIKPSTPAAKPVKAAVTLSKPAVTLSKPAVTLSKAAPRAKPPAPARVPTEPPGAFFAGAGGRAWRMSGKHAVAYVRDAALAGELLATETRHLARSAMAVYYDRKGKPFAWQLRFDTARWEEVVGRLGVVEPGEGRVYSDGPPLWAMDKAPVISSLVLSPALQDCPDPLHS